MPEAERLTPSAAGTGQNLTFFLEKTSSFQTYHVDGVFGNLTPAGEIFLAFYLERAPIPKTIVCQIQANGDLGEPTFAGKQGIYREVQSAIVLSPKALEELKNHIEKLQQMLVVAHRDVVQPES